MSLIPEVSRSSPENADTATGTWCDEFYHWVVTSTFPDGFGTMDGGYALAAFLVLSVAIILASGAFTLPGREGETESGPQEDDTSVENVRKSAEAIARAARHMNRLVETVLDDARLEPSGDGFVELPEDYLRVSHDNSSTSLQRACALPASASPWDATRASCSKT